MATAEGAVESMMGSQEIEGCGEGGAEAGALVGGEGAAVAEELEARGGVTEGEGFEVGGLGGERELRGVGDEDGDAVAGADEGLGKGADEGAGAVAGEARIGLGEEEEVERTVGGQSRRSLTE